MSLSFVTKPTEEEKKIRKLKYNIFVNGKVISEGTGTLGTGSWAFLVVDINENKTVIDAKEENTNELRIELTGIIESLKWISNHTEQKYKKFVQIILHTSSIYCYNLLNEWIELWTKDETISQRPNLDLLQQVYKYKKVMNITPKLTYKVSNEHAWLVDRKVNEKLNLHI
jgi:ribonuclease HI